jgi:hypothetical protein
MASAGSIFKGCAIGCGVAVLVSVVTVVGCGVTLVAPFKSAQDTREKIEEAYGVQEDYRPRPDGAIPDDRLDAFLAVRGELMEHCRGFDETFDQFERMEEIDDQDVPKSVMFREVLGTVGKAMGLAGRMGSYAKDRNETLLDRGMGLGEYTYIFVTVYYSWLGKDVQPGSREFDEDRATTRVRKALREMLRSQLEDLRAASPDSPLIEELRAEIEILNDDHDRLPWRDGPPAAVTAGLEPRRAEIEAVWCEGTSPFELHIHRSENKGFSIYTE